MVKGGRRPSPARGVDSLCPVRLCVACLTPHAIGSFGGGWLEHPRQCLGAQRVDLSLRVTEPPKAARRALRRHRSRAGALPRLHFDHAAAPVEARPSCNPMCLRLQP
eukprot:scaffold79217_cov52-Phaeocystis_antarctica.AAC.2